MQKFTSLILILILVQTILAIDNGLGYKPPMGWRSWNCFGREITQDKMQSVMKKMATKYQGISLLEVGYTDVGLDDNWQKCGAGFRGSFHDEDGNPIVNTERFPNMTAMTDYAHSLNLTAGWYGNNCICKEKYLNETTEQDLILKHYQGDVKATIDYGFDAIKLDGCGQFYNLTLWAELYNKTGKPIMIEDCHWGQTVPDSRDVSDCPYNFYRSSGDITATWASMLKNLYTTLQFSNETTEPSRNYPGCWAYPDMLEVGRLGTVAEDRSHFGAWVITSSPLTLGYDVRDDLVNYFVWDIITNQEAIAVSQTWAGHPGTFLRKDGQCSIWTKPQPNGALAIFIMNEEINEQRVTIDFRTLGLQGNYKIRNIWEHKDEGEDNILTTPTLIVHDSAFYLLTPSEEY